MTKLYPVARFRGKIHHRSQDHSADQLNNSINVRLWFKLYIKSMNTRGIIAEAKLDTIKKIDAKITMILHKVVHDNNCVFRFEIIYLIPKLFSFIAHWIIVSRIFATRMVPIMFYNYFRISPNGRSNIINMLKSTSLCIKLLGKF